jgi:hypothetical protein
MCNCSQTVACRSGISIFYKFKTPVMLDHREIRDCALLATAVYMGNEVEMKAFLAQNGHRFNAGVTVSTLPINCSRYVIAQMTEDGHTTTYLAIRGGIGLDDWNPKDRRWPSCYKRELVHADWYAGMSHLPEKFLVQCIREGHRVLICGHSLGAAVAQLLTLSVLDAFAGDAAGNECRSRIMCVSFAGPMVCSRGMAGEANRHSKDNFVNFVHSRDALPTIISFAQVALPGLISQYGRHQPINPLLTMLCTAADPAAYRQLSASVTAGIKALEDSAVVTVPLPYGPIGHYYRIDEAAGVPLAPLSSFELDNTVIWSTVVRLTTDAPAPVHGMATVYLQGSLSRLNQDAIRGVVKTEPPSLQLPQPVVGRVNLHRNGSGILVEIFGAHLYMVQRVDSSALPLCQLRNVRVTPNALVSASKLTFNVLPLPREIHVPAPVSATTTAQLSVSPGLCWKDSITFNNVPVTTVDTHPLDLCTLQEVVMAGIYLLLFVSRQPGHVDHPKLITLRKLLVETLATIPLLVFFDATSPVAAYCFSGHADTVVPILIQDEKGQEAIQNFITHWGGEHDADHAPPPPSGTDTTTDLNEADKMRGCIEALRKCVATHTATCASPPRGARAQDNILTLLARCVNPPQREPEQGFTVLLSVLEGPLQQARAAMQTSLTSKTYSDFIGALGVALASAENFVKALGKYFNPSQQGLGPLNDAMGAFLDNTYVKKAVQVVSTGLTGAGSATTLMLNVAIMACLASAPVYLAAYAGLAASGKGLGYLFDGFPSDVLNSSAGLCAKVLAHLKVSVAEGATTGEMEAMLAQKLKITSGFGPFGDAGDLNQLLSACFPFVTSNHEQIPDVLRRLKLLVLCDAFRETLKQLPVALITGPTRSGKSTFREHMQNGGPNRDRYGSFARHRTSVPELFFCGEHDRSIGLLDSIGIGDTTNLEVFAAIEKANKIFRVFCQASIIVVNESDASPAGRGLLHCTSVVRPRNGSTDAAPLHHPTITCITNADRMFGQGASFPQGEGGPADLVTEARDRVVRGEPFDLRAPQVDPFAPRVLACFESRIQVPEEYHGVVYTTAQVREWLYSHFYPNR